MGCSAPLVEDASSNSYVITGQHPSPPPTPAYCNVEPLVQQSVAVMPTYTEFTLRDAAATFTVMLRFVSTMFANDYARLSRPVYTLEVGVAGAGVAAGAAVYFDMSAQHVVNEDAEPVQWAPWSTSNSAGEVKGFKLGTVAQCVLCSKGDKTNINWGNLYLGPVGTGSAYAGSADTARTAFTTSGVLPAAPDPRTPRSSSDDMPAVAATATVQPAGLARFVVAYDDVASVAYYGTPFRAYWTTVWPTIEAAISNATEPAEMQYVYKIQDQFNAALVADLHSVGGAEFSQIGALAYRQTLAATKLVQNNQTGSIGNGQMWNFLKEISTNGDMQTMDVVYPASPMLLYSNPALLRLLLIPVLNFANNGTNTPFSNPFSPHQIGTYPIADATTESQEPMPMENTGNMFLMLAGIIQRESSTDWLKPFMPMLTTWADYLVASLPFPANQLCTDDFTGRLANNTNLAAKGIVALEAFAHLCTTTGGTGCEKYSMAAAGFVSTWIKEALEHEPAPHYKIAYNFPNSFSIKYNLVWQKLLNFSGPFPWDEVVTKTEIPYYVAHSNQYGPPMDSRHTYVKLDWLAWGATMADSNSDFHKMADPIFAQANATECRVPLTDLFDTISATCAYGKKAFVARPVVGGVFAKMLAPGPYSPAL